MNMKILIPAIAAASLFGCSDNITKEYNSNNSTATQEIELKGTLQGAIYDAKTGARIGGNDLEIYLIQGTDQRKPSKVVNDTASVLAGEYAFDNIPVTSPELLSSTFKLVVYKPGFQVFESEFSFTQEYTNFIDTNNIKSIDGHVYAEDLTNILSYESVINKIGNVYLYPDTATAQDVKIVAVSHGNNVAGLPVTLRRLSNWETIAGTSTTVGSPTDAEGAGRDTRLINTVGRFDVMTAVTDKNGMATFAAEDLVLGARYQASVGPGEVNDTLYVVTKGLVFEAGVTAGSGIQTIDMGLAVNMPAVTIESVEYSETNGAVRITLSRAIGIQNAKGIAVDVTSSLGDDITATATATLSTDGRVLTITPTFKPALSTLDPQDITITYSPADTNPLTYLVQNYTGVEPVEVFGMDPAHEDWDYTLTLE